MSTQEVATAFTDLCKAGAFEEAGRRFWATTVRSIEPFEGPEAIADGIDAVMGKSAWWYGAHEVHSVTTDGPFVCGSQFALRFDMDVTVKATGERNAGREVAVYTVEDGKIVEERFFYG